MFEFIHAADIHLDSPLRGLERYEGAPVEEIRLATRRALENLVSLAIERQVAFVIIAGDLFDGDWKDYNTGLFFAKQMTRLREAKISVFIVKGNHDAANRITKALQLPDNVKIFSHLKPETFKLDNIAVALHGQSFPTAATVSNLSQGYPAPVKDYFNIGVLHTCATGREGHEKYAPCSISDLVAKEYNYWALGHVHNREILSTNPLIIFPGNIQGRHARETGPKGCTLLTVDDNQDTSEKFVELGVMRWETCTVDLSDAQHEAEILSLVGKSLSQLLEQSDSKPMAIRVELSGETHFNLTLRSGIEHWTNQIRAVATDFGRDKIWIEKVKFHTTETNTTSNEFSEDGPLNELTSLIESIRQDKDKLSYLKLEIEELERKLPMDVKAQINWNRDDFLAEALNDAEDILLNQLAGKRPLV